MTGKHLPEYQDYPLEMQERIYADRIPEPHWPDEALAAAPAAVRRQQCTGTSIGPERLREDRFGYHASIAFADQEFGRILQTLDEQRLADNTWVFFLIDHGDMLGDRLMESLIAWLRQHKPITEWKQDVDASYKLARNNR